MTATANTGRTPAQPTQVQVLAAKVWMKADRRLNRASSSRIESIAAGGKYSASKHRQQKPSEG